MRAVSLSKPAAIDLLSRYFVPVLLSTDDYGKQKKSRSEEVEWELVRQSATSKGLFHGTVTAYVIDPQGAVITSMDVGDALHSEKFERMLTKVVEDLHLEPRAVDAVRASASTQIAAPRLKYRTGLLLHIWTCYLPSSGDNRGASEDWLELGSADWSALVPPADVHAGDSWEVPRRVTDKLYRYFYPAVCIYTPKDSRIARADLTATVSAVRPGAVEVSLHGFADLDHNGDKEDAGRVVARLAGALRYDPSQRLITSFQLASEKAVFAWDYHGKVHTPTIAIAVESVSTSK
jgi:hypothetical protein